MTGPNSRAGRQAAPVPQAASVSAPHAALLIDFDNVTLGIRSDLTNELKTLLNSDIIRGKVAVQRAYADWRRYSQYVMPLTERSIDLIFATAVGSTKKNATDIRLAIDAVELVFTRPEIGTFILLSGDSDFSSLVIKLKEYGKYVIGVGIRESAGDLLIQNCDEYYSYNELAGLTKEEEPSSVQRDPWELVGEAVAQMSRQGDVMRSDRLKQVMQELDPNFDERNAGFNRFSKFVSEAGNRRILRVTKLDNGQFEVAPLDSAPRIDVPPSTPRSEDENGSRGRGGRGRGRGRGRPDKTERAAERPAERRPERAAERPAASAAPAPSQLTLGAAFSLLTRALGELEAPAAQDALRARMAALHGREDPLLDAGRFERFLRQANDAEVADVRKTAEGSFEISLPRSARLHAQNQARSAAPAAPAASVPVDETGEIPAATGPVATPSRPATLRFRRGSRAAPRPPAIPLVGVVAPEPKLAPEPVPAEEPAVAAKATRATGRKRSPARRKPAAATDGQPAAGAEPGQPGEAEPAKRRGRGARKR